MVRTGCIPVTHGSLGKHVLQRFNRRVHVPEALPMRDHPQPSGNGIVPAFHPCVHAFLAQGPHHVVDAPTVEFQPGDSHPAVQFRDLAATKR